MKRERKIEGLVSGGDTGRESERERETEREAELRTAQEMNGKEGDFCGSYKSPILQNSSP